MVEARVALAGARRRRRIDTVEVVEHRIDRRVQAVEVEAVEAGAARVVGKSLVVRLEPLDEARDLGIAPHPAREPLEVAERRRRRLVGTGRTADVAVHAVSIGPVGFDRHGREALLATSRSVMAARAR